MFILYCKNNHQTFYSKYKKSIIFFCIIIFLFIANFIKRFIKEINEQEQKKAIEEYARQIIKKTQQTNEKIEEINALARQERETRSKLEERNIELETKNMEIEWYLRNKTKPNYLRETAPNSPRAIEKKYPKKLN